MSLIVPVSGRPCPCMVILRILYLMSSSFQFSNIFLQSELSEFRFTDESTLSELKACLDKESEIVTDEFKKLFTEKEDTIKIDDQQIKATPIARL